MLNFSDLISFSCQLQMSQKDKIFKYQEEREREKEKKMKGEEKKNTNKITNLEHQYKKNERKHICTHRKRKKTLNSQQKFKYIIYTIK